MLKEIPKFKNYWKTLSPEQKRKSAMKIYLAKKKLKEHDPFDFSADFKDIKF